MDIRAETQKIFSSRRAGALMIAAWATLFGFTGAGCVGNVDVANHEVRLDAGAPDANAPDATMPNETGGDDLTSACTEYARAYCELAGQCAPPTALDCSRTAAACPDLFFSPGSTHTRESVEACTAGLRGLSWSNGRRCGACKRIGRKIFPNSSRT